ncbi:ATP synthase F0 subunit B [Granulicella cerasi]|uniref:ATP synthase subunit b n=1 Tax=Granulicella cerasi TaxID=741063 RepID=A0ABW1Z812_9BACT|nr:ATP synthase F0 subunit B [Granulicella cerasi]
MANLSKKLMMAAMALVLFAPASVAPRAFAQEASQGISVPSSSPMAKVPEKKQEVKDEDEEFRHSPMVQKMGKALGMNVEQAATAFTVLNFVLLAFAVGFGLLKILPKTFRERSSNIQKQLVDARTATEEATARLNSVEERLAKLDTQIADYRTQAKADSERDEQRIKQSVEDEKVKIVAAAESEIHNATAMARREIQKYAAELAVEQAARKLVVTAETDRLLVESFANKLGGKGGAN